MQVSAPPVSKIIKTLWLGALLMLVAGSAWSQTAQTITFANPGAQTFGTSPDLSTLGGGASATSGLAVTFTSSTTGVCTVTSGGVLSFVSAGSCTVNADQAGDGTYAAAPTVSQSFTVNAIAPGAPIIGSVTAGDSQVSVAFMAPASTGGAPLTGYTVSASPADVAPVSGASSPIVVTGLINGQPYTFSVTASNAAGTSLASGDSSVVTPKFPQTITFANPGAQNFGTAPSLTATATSSLTVTFTSSTTSVCTTTSGGALTFIAAGTCTINADQAGNGLYLAASQVSRSFAVNAIVPGAPTIGTATAGGNQATVTFSAPASNGGATITGYTVTSSPGGLTGTGSSSPITVAGLSNGTTYTFTVTATNSAGTGSASAASNSVMPKAAQTIAFANPGTQTVGTKPTLTATSTSGLAVTFTSSTTGVCAITSGGALTLVSAGTCTIGADQLGNGSFLAATQVSQSFNVNAVPTLPTATSSGVSSSIAPLVVQQASSQASSLLAGRISQAVSNAIGGTGGGIGGGFGGGVGGGFGGGGFLLNSQSPGGTAIMSPTPKDGFASHQTGGMQAQAALNSLADGRYLGGKLAFLPHSYLTGDTRADGIYAMGDGSYQVVFDGASVTLVSAVVNLDQLAALFPGVNALQANNGVLTAHVGATTYVVQAGINVGSRAATGTAFLETDAEGYTHFIDAQGNEQVLFPAFREFATLRAALRTQDPFVTLSTEFNGTITMVSRNVTSRLVPDITLIVVPAQRLGQDLWQESSSRWCYANAQFQPVAGRAQCYTVR